MTASHPVAARPHLHVIYEYGKDYRPYSSSFLRLIRPLSHPQAKTQLETTFSQDYTGEPADLVLIDRLWRWDVSLPAIQELVNRVRLKGIRLIYCLDDSYPDLESVSSGRPASEVMPVVAFLLRQANAVLVTTPALRQRLLEYNAHIYVLPNQLDERLLVYRPPGLISGLVDRGRIVIGCMGTFTHDDDFLSVLPALRSTCERHAGQVEIQVIGMVDRAETKSQLQALPVRFIYPRIEEHEYPLFMLWFTGHVRWDIAISPLKATPFNNCKSDVKFLDYAALGVPAVLSDSPAYSSSVQQMQNGWLVANSTDAWEHALETLIGDASLRYKLATGASQYLYTERILAHRAADWVSLLKSLC